MLVIHHIKTGCLHPQTDQQDVVVSTKRKTFAVVSHTLARVCIVVRELCANIKRLRLILKSFSRQGNELELTQKVFKSEKRSVSLHRNNNKKALQQQLRGKESINLVGATTAFVPAPMTTIRRVVSRFVTSQKIDYGCART